MKNIDMPFQERFDLLIGSGQANERSVAATRLALSMVEEYFGIQLEEELGASLASHLAITLKRLLDNETLSEATDVVWDELRNYPQELAMSAFIVDELEKVLDRSISRDEVGFIALHLCVIKEKIRNGPNKVCS